MALAADSMALDVSRITCAIEAETSSPEPLPPLTTMGFSRSFIRSRMSIRSRLMEVFISSTSSWSFSSFTSGSSEEAEAMMWST
ncbi:MAG: hypothetical protein A4E36_00026 [Methanoregulaceae archaeon PtaB.Bin009]|nr:MAG: hypothetical protein A4E36_00026 [Methanoregulaceae archaeon PtaB.Bin009]